MASVSKKFRVKLYFPEATPSTLGMNWIHGSRIAVSTATCVHGSSIIYKSLIPLFGKFVNIECGKISVHKTDIVLIR